MAGGRQYSSSSSFSCINRTTKSPFLLATLTILSLSLLFYIFSFFSTSPPQPQPQPQPHSAASIRSSGSGSDSDSQEPRLKPDVDYSFLVSLDKFLSTLGSTVPIPPDDTQQDVTQLDHLIWTSETSRLSDSLYSPSPSPSPLRVYVYDMPPKFTYDMLWLFHNTYKDTFNLTSNGSPVHRLIEQHSIDYWLWRDLITPESERLLKNVVRVKRQEDADLFYVPFFTTISFFLLEKQQCKALYRVML